jgi:hypothetical protein
MERHQLDGADNPEPERRPGQPAGRGGLLGGPRVHCGRRYRQCLRDPRHRTLAERYS